MRFYSGSLVRPWRFFTEVAPSGIQGSAVRAVGTYLDLGAERSLAEPAMQHANFS
jgi:hypothetical protein